MIDKRKQGKRNKRAGYYYETKVVKQAQSAGLPAERVWGSGATPLAKQDVVIEGERYEVKSRKTGFAFDSELNDQAVRGLITFDTSTPGLPALIRLRLTDYLQLRAELAHLRQRLKVLAALNDLKAQELNDKT